MSTIDKNSKIAVYLRKSRLDVNNPEETLLKHKDEIKRHIKKQGYTDVTWYEEVGSGESIDARPEMVQLLSDIESGRYAAVIADHIDRFSRGSMTDNDRIITTFMNAGCLLFTTSNNRTYDFRDADKTLMNEVELLFSREEYRTIQRRLNNGKKRTFESGKISGSKPPFGYYKDYNTDEYLIDREKADVYLWIVDRYIRGHSTHGISQELNKNAIPSPSGKPGACWSHGYVNHMLKNKFYAGHVVIGKTKMFKEGNKIKRKRQNDPLQWETRKGAHEPLISEETYEEIIEKIRRSVKNPPSTRSNKFRLTGLVRCMACGYGVTVRRKVQVNGNEYSVLRKCKYPLPGGETCEANKGLKEQLLVDALREHAQQFRDKLFRVADNIEASPKLDTNPIKIQQSIIDGSKSKINRAKLLFLEGDLEKAEYDSIKEEQTKIVNEAAKELEQLLITPQEKQEIRRKLWKPVDLEKLFGEEMSPEEFNRVLKKLVESISYLYDGEELHMDIVYK